MARLHSKLPILTHVQNRFAHSANRFACRPAALLCLISLALPFAAAAQSSFRDPQGLFEVRVPAGWVATYDKEASQATLQKGAVQEIIHVSLQNKSNAMTAKEFINGNAKEFKEQCPTTQSRQSGSSVLAGYPAEFELFTCSDPKSPAVAETDSVLTKDLILIAVTTISPVDRYAESLKTLDAIRDSLRLVNPTTPPAAIKSDEATTRKEQLDELHKACLVGAMAQEDCARKEGILLAQEKPSGTDASTISGDVYRDPKGRFSVAIPNGWKAISEGENGILGVQLRSGSNWINVMPAKGAASASEVVLHQEQEVAKNSNTNRKPPFGRIGLIQLFGNDVELTYDHFSASSPQGDAIESYVGGVGDISGTGQEFMLLIASIRPRPDGESKSDEGGAAFLKAAQSIRLTGK